ncbi:MAG: aromatic ring-hydroxylating dioxygenase subunit alpha [Deltaproteobacteria bacterium]|nr:aromatic ring-hydroxylating dioxygenase subunit alpha [Deltaproteobacteria bacterium]
MSTRAPFMNTEYSGYYHRDVPKENEELTHVGPNTPCGEYLRRFWQPVAYSDELTDLPKKLRIMGEDLVIYRDFGGNVGLLELHCAHRGTSLEYGLVSQCGIRCCYHGWLFDRNGAILETPGEPADSTLKDRLFQGAYPIHESNGLIFTYMGPPENRPHFPLYDSMIRPGYKMMPGQSYVLPCNWLQVAENGMDPVHTSFLHTIVTGAQFTDEFGVIPELEYVETPSGMVYVAGRRVGNNVWIRMVDNVHPNMQQVAPVWENGRDVHPFDGPMMTRWIVPIDDEKTMLIELRHISEEDEVTPAWWADGTMLPAQVPISDSLEEQQRQPGDYEAQTSQRSIAVHGLEHLGATDRGVIVYRRQIRQGIQAVKEGRDPLGLSPGADIPMPTFSNDAVVEARPGATPVEEVKLIKDIGRRLIEEYIEDPPNLRHLK